ncbi:MAG: ABC transporter substrate-binding protein, partial [Rhodobacteraceae bacterium]|nr:ABC transporter substrate-binding protein [Paracoccaceae bacterium]
MARTALLALAVALAWLAPAVAQAPARVVSMNLCTDQLAMLIAAPGQLVSVSHVARDPVSSALAAEAAAYPVNHATAEEIFLLAPDLVLAGAYDRPATLAALARLGLAVETFPIEASFQDVRGSVTRMGALLGQPDRAAALIAAMDAELADPPAGSRPRVALFYANAYSSGAGTLAHAILEAAGLANIAAERGVTGLARLPLETLVLEAPE